MRIFYCCGLNGGRTDLVVQSVSGEMRSSRDLQCHEQDFTNAGRAWVGMCC